VRAASEPLIIYSRAAPGLADPTRAGRSPSGASLVHRGNGLGYRQSYNHRRTPAPWRSVSPRLPSAAMLGLLLKDPQAVRAPIKPDLSEARGI